MSNYSSWIFCSDRTSPTGLCPTSFVNFGAGNAGAIDNYVYLLGATEDNFIGDGTLGLCSCTYLARVLNDNTSLLTKASYQVYTGVNAAGVAQWSNTWSNMQPIFVDHGPRPMHLGKMVYNSALQRFISVAQGGSVNQAAFYDSPNPWGPFTTIAYYNSNLNKTGGWGNLGDGWAEALVLQASHMAYLDMSPAAVPGVVAVLDGRNALDPAPWRAAGIKYAGIGR